MPRAIRAAAIMAVAEHVDVVERAAIDRLKQLFGAGFANVQPHSGAQANGAVKLALLQPGDTILGMSLDAGGHLTHGCQAGAVRQMVQAGAIWPGPGRPYRFRQVAAIARAEKPQMIIAGASAYSRIIDFAPFREIADEVGAWLLVDMAHIAGLVAAACTRRRCRMPMWSPRPPTRRCAAPRGGFILSNDEAMAKKINSAVFPGLQGGPLMHVIAAKAVAFGEALKPEFKTYAQRVVDSAKALSQVMIDRGCAIVSGGTDNHLMLVDLRPKGVKGNAAEAALERAGITCNKNGGAGRSGKADRHQRHSRRHSRRMQPRFRPRGVRSGRSSDQRRARRSCRPCGRRPRGRGQDTCAGEGSVRPVSHLLTARVKRHASLRSRCHRRRPRRLCRRHPRRTAGPERRLRRGARGARREPASMSACIPSKTLLTSSAKYAELAHLAAHGIAIEGARLDLSAMMARKDKDGRRSDQGHRLPVQEKRHRAGRGLGRRSRRRAASMSPAKPVAAA